MQKAFEEFGIRITDQEALDFQKIYADRQHHIHMSPLMQDILAFCSGRADLGIITNGPSEHQWDKVRSLQAEKWIPHENIFVSADVGAEKPDRKIFDAGWNAVWMNRRKREAPESERQPEQECGNASCLVCVETEEELRNFIIRILRGDVE